MLTLNQGMSSMVVAPEYGGGVLGWLRGEVAIFRRALPQAVMRDRHALACFPLVPYANRIANGRFTWNGQAYTLARNAGDSPHTIHGIGRQSSWDVVDARPNAVTLGLRHAGDAAWPFGFEASVSYALTETGLSVALSMTNRHDAPAPAGLGLHPYFLKQDDPALRFHAEGVWRTGPDSLPTEQGSVPAEWSCERMKPVADLPLDNCFTGWDRVVETKAGAASLRLEASEAFGNLQVFTPSWTDFFCAEPVTHTPDAINRPDLPPEQRMTALAPGATLAGTIALTLLRP
ncbi:MAG TPA: aldose 1-epimerase [Rhodopila sp.]|uniref:aldose 1-epimerase n=1 Tax=Rhodopila sp. TaxID=2480087 RepID=UPI002BC79586|nr:aldose 1-epimerase [Rhodopila sp.]HVY16852.1 aldose 1-epimerase [Rhodopila sp.]